MLTQFVELKPGDWLMQNAANSAVGKLIVRLAALKGIRTLNLVRRESLVGELKALGADGVLVGEENLTERVKGHLEGHSLRLALDAIAGESSGRMLECLGPGGVLVVYGLLSNQPAQLPAAKLVFGDVSVTGFSRLGTYLCQAGLRQGASPLQRARRDGSGRPAHQRDRGGVPAVTRQRNRGPRRTRRQVREDRALDDAVRLGLVAQLFDALENQP